MKKKKKIKIYTSEFGTGSTLRYITEQEKKNRENISEKKLLRRLRFLAFEVLCDFILSCFLAYVCFTTYSFNYWYEYIILGFVFETLLLFFVFTSIHQYLCIQYKYMTEKKNKEKLYQRKK